MALPSRKGFSIACISFAFSLFSLFGFSQEDSLKNILYSKEPDSTRTEAALRLSMIYSSNNPEYCIVVANKGIEIANQSKFIKHLPALIKLKGVAYVNQGEYKKSAEEYFKALKEAEKQENKKEIAAVYNNLGVNFWYQKDYKTALKYHQKSLEYRRLLNNSKDIAKSYNNLGTVEVDMGNYNDAIAHYKIANHLKDSLGDKVGMANGYNNLGIVYERLQQLDEAKAYYEKALKVFTEEGDKRGELVSINNIAAIYKNQKKFKEGLQLGAKAVVLAEEINDPEDLKTAYEVMALCSYHTGQYKTAYDYLEKFSMVKDTLASTENFQNVQELEKKYNSEKQEKEIKILQQANEIKDIEIRESETKRRNLLLIIGLALLLIVLSAFAFFKISKQKQALETSKKNIELKNYQLELQKKEIVDSINYAKRIQDAMLKDEEHTSSHLPPHFIMFKPKDIVSGDFYWALEKENFLYFAAADCTGHGVPGAFLTLLGTSFLNEINATDKVLSPAQILDQLREKFVKELSSTHEKTRDGMDISMIRINIKTLEAVWAGAYNPLWVIKNGENVISEMPADKQPVGYSEIITNFTDNSITFQKGDQFFLFTDGYADQFGGKDGKKFKHKQLKSILAEIKDLNPDNQKQKLLESFDKWRGNLEQVDDVLIIGIKL